MNISKKLSAFVLALFGVIAACGDHVVVPKDSTGKCNALLNKCGEICVDLQSDLANCGACGSACAGAKLCVMGKCADACPAGTTRCGDACVNVDVDRANCGMCGKACVGAEVCAKGKCMASCEAVGYTTCAGMSGPVDAGMAMNCVDSKSDSNNCGACNNKCMGSDACSNGTCCGAGLIGCNGKCIDPQSDEANCGACGNVCPMAGPHCVLGTCSKCNNEVLILADNSTATNVNMKKSFQTAGFATTLIDGGSASYSGTPAATDFGAIVVVRIGFLNGMDMPMAGQQAIVAAQQAGAGIVVDAYDMYDATQYNRIQLLKPFMLYGFTNGISSTGPVSQFGSQPMFFAGVPGSFSTANSNAWFYGPPQNGGTQFANVVAGMSIPAGYYRASPNGRIVHFGFGINWSSSQSMWANDPVQVVWFLNGVRYAAGCTN